MSSCKVFIDNQQKKHQLKTINWTLELAQGEPVVERSTWHSIKIWKWNTKYEKRVSTDQWPIKQSSGSKLKPNAWNS